MVCMDCHHSKSGGFPLPAHKHEIDRMMKEWRENREGCEKDAKEFEEEILNPLFNKYGRNNQNP